MSTVQPFARSAYSSLFPNNPVLDYLNRRSWRRFRKWGWLLAALPLGDAGFHLLLEGIFAAQGVTGSAGGPPPGVISTLFNGSALYVLAAILAAFSFGGVARLLAPERVEGLFLTAISPAQVWTAVFVNLNRNLLLLGLFSLPLLLPIASLSGLPAPLILRHIGLIYLFANLWALAFGVLTLQRGPRFGAFLSLVFLSALLFFSAFILAYGMVNQSRGYVPTLLVLHPGVFLIRDLLPIAEALHRVEAPEPFTTRVVALGWETPLGLVAPVIFILAVATGIAILLTGPCRIPAAQKTGSAEDAPGTEGKGGARKSRIGLGRLADVQIGPVFKSGPYMWRQIVDRIYLNTPPLLRRWRYLAKNIAAGGLWLFFVVGAVDVLHLTRGMFGQQRFSGAQRPIQTDTIGGYLALLGFLGVMAGFHFAYAGAKAPAMPGTPPEPLPRHRFRAYAFKMAVLIGAIWASGFSWSRQLVFWPFLVPRASMAFGVAALILAAQLAFQLWASARSSTQRRAFMAGMGHWVAVWLLPLLPFFFIYWAPTLLFPWIIRLAFLSPLMPWIQFQNGFSGTFHLSENRVVPFYPQPAFAALLAIVELIVWSVLLLASRARRKAR